ncbi:unnamed protein product [Ectocarpus sp. 12 AP-2014]
MVGDIDDHESLKCGKTKVFWRIDVLPKSVCRKRSVVRYSGSWACDGSSCVMVSTRLCAS